MKNTYKLADSVLARIVQIIQEGMMVGIDVTDLMRQIELEVELDEMGLATGNLVQTPEYIALVERTHQQYLDRAKQLQEEGN